MTDDRATLRAVPDPHFEPDTDDPPASTTAVPDPVVALWDRRTTARFLGIGTTTLDGLARSGALPAVRIGRRVLFHRDDLAAYLDRMRRGAA